jgi:hypothetical protein
MNNETLKFILTTFMELATLAAVYAGLRLYRRNKWLRLAIIVVPLLLNTLLYIVYAMPLFFYMAVMLLLCIPFVWPRKSA